jgi:hypothetical protein
MCWSSSLSWTSVVVINLNGLHQQSVPGKPLFSIKISYNESFLNDMVKFFASLLLSVVL